MNTRVKGVIGLLSVAFFAGCIGTDFLDESVDLIPARIELSPAVGSIEVGQTVAYEATYFDSTGMPAPATFEWTSSRTGIASVSDGVAFGLEVGQTRITAAAHGVSSEALLTVIADPNQVALVTVSPMTAAVAEGESIAFTATVYNGRNEVLSDRTVDWSIDIDTLATVDEQGVVQALKAGRVKVVATVEGVESAPADLEILAQSRTGTFRQAPGSSYTVAGTAILEQIEGGGLQVRFLENFTVSNGPDLYVYLSSEGRVNAGSLSLGQLQSIAGFQMYPVPSNVRIGDFDNVLIHCRPFNVTFGYAPFN